MWVCQVLKQQTPPEKKKGVGSIVTTASGSFGGT
jgi:hypothetical protein